MLGPCWCAFSQGFVCVYTSIYALLISAPDVGAVRKRLALLCGEKRLWESLTYGQLLEMLGALEEHEENAALNEESQRLDPSSKRRVGRRILPASAGVCTENNTT